MSTFTDSLNDQLANEFGASQPGESIGHGGVDVLAPPAAGGAL
jgi:hypothetical protein